MNTAQKDRLASIVRSVNMVTETPGGMCIFRAICGQVALKAVGISAGIAAGGMLYRAGRDEILDTCAFAGRDFGGGVLEDGTFLGHFWLETADHSTLIDFSCGDWREVSDEGTDVFSPDARWIDWQRPPPCYYWRSADQFRYPEGSGAQAPELGRAWYTGWSARSLVGPGVLIGQVMDLLGGDAGQRILGNIFRQAKISRK